MPMFSFSSVFSAATASSFAWRSYAVCCAIGQRQLVRFAALSALDVTCALRSERTVCTSAVNAEPYPLSAAKFRTQGRTLAAADSRHKTVPANIRTERTVMCMYRRRRIFTTAPARSDPKERLRADAVEFIRTFCPYYISGSPGFAVGLACRIPCTAVVCGCTLRVVRTFCTDKLVCTDARRFWRRNPYSSCMYGLYVHFVRTFSTYDCSVPVCYGWVGGRHAGTVKLPRENLLAVFPFPFPALKTRKKVPKVFIYA